jgi:hypothetical protein
VVRDIRVEVSEEQYDRLTELKKAHGLTWLGMLLQAADSLEND